ncbi:MAG: type II secretion system protein [Pseudomonadota bacterium]
MKKFMKIKRAEKGFTLIEVIVTIVIAAILGTMLVTFMTSVPKSVNPVIQTHNLAAAIAVMEQITSEYELYIRTVPLNSTAWSTIGSGYATAAITDDAVSSNTIYGNPTTFNMREVTVTEGDQKLVSYFVE